MNVQARILDPFTQLWSGMETDKDKLDKEETKSEEMREGMANVSTLYEKTVILIGQTINNLLYQRRFNALFNDKKKALSLGSRNTKDLINNDDTYLFGDKFEEKVIKTQKMKVEKTSLEGQ